jgi:hypothetical protein
MVTESYDASRGVAKIDQWMRRNRQHPRTAEAVTKPGDLRLAMRLRY